MKTFLRVKIVDESNDDNHVLIWQQDFQTTDRFNRELDDTLYNKVLELNSIYNFIDYDNCPDFEIYTILVTEDNGKILKEKVIGIDDCVQYMYNI